MRSAFYSFSSDQRDPQLRRRVPGFLLVLAIHILLLLIVFRPGQPLPVPPKPEPKVFSVQSIAGKSAAAKPAPHAARAARVAPPRAAAAIVVPPPVPQPLPTKPLDMLVMSKDEFAAADIGKITSQHGASGSADATGAGQGSGSADGAGTGPGGERLYNAEWYAEPTHAELATYLSAVHTQKGWGMIACRTIPNFHVEDCQELAESPSGSGLARALRQAAWQFRVRPPRIGGRAMVGEWVRIRFDFTENVAK